MPELVCERCGHQSVWGLLSSRAWLEARDENGNHCHICPTCAAELTEAERRAFVESGAVDRRSA
jgi:hypothetical protein